MPIKPRAFYLLIALCISCRTQPLSHQPWSFPENIGVVFEKAGKVCFEIQNPALQENSQIRILNPSPPQTTALARVGSRNESCASGGSATDHYHGYEVRLEEGAAAMQAPVIGIVNYRGDFQKDGDLLSADLDGNGQPEYFRACASTEGIHFTIWTGKPLNGRLRWHQYYYLGYDVSATCTSGELESPK